MAYADPPIRHLTLREVLHRLTGLVGLGRGEPVPSRAVQDGCPAFLDPGTLYDIGACQAFRDYRSAVTLGAGTQPRLGRMGEAARWNAMW